MKDQDRTEADVVGSFHGLRALVIGDALLDTFLEGSAPRISREAPVPVVEQQAEHHFPGGAANAAANLSALGAEVAFVGMVGDDVTGTSLRSALQEAGVDDRWLVTDPNVTTARKLRVLAHDQYLVRVDEGSLSACAPGARRALLNHVERLGPQSDLIVISDYGYSTVSEEIVEWLCKLRADHPCTLAIDSRDVRRFSRAGATLVTPNLEEARVAVAPGNPSEAEPMDVARRLREKLDAENIAITMGGDGVLLADAEGHITHLPTRPIRKPDDVGAGDSFIAAAALALATGARPELAARIGIDAATIVCTKPRVAVVTNRELLRRVSLSQQRAPSAPLSVKEIAVR
ncbi:MAG TPA: PfkB family carbohydrate kinase, partial [Thermomicrobiales bacterium]|nr:PfkB family carbohydrate kinase [Thermomicrobiales bacterium]